MLVRNASLHYRKLIFLFSKWTSKFHNFGLHFIYEIIIYVWLFDNDKKNYANMWSNFWLKTHLRKKVPEIYVSKDYYTKKYYICIICFIIRFWPWILYSVAAVNNENHKLNFRFLDYVHGIKSHVSSRHVLGRDQYCIQYFLW